MILATMIWRTTNPLRVILRRATAAALLGLLAGVAQAGPTLALDAQARAAVANDEMVVTLAAERDGQQVGLLNDAVLALLDGAIAEAKAVPAVRARLGAVTTHPLFTREGRPNGWRVRGEVILVSDRMRVLGQLGGRLAERMHLAGVQFRLSPERRAAEERRLLVEAARAFRTRAADAAEAFGYRTFDMKELSIRSGGGMPPPRPQLAARAAEAMAAPIPSEGGDTDVVVAVTGTVELKP